MQTLIRHCLDLPVECHISFHQHIPFESDDEPPTTEVLPIFIHLQEPLLCSLLRDIALDCPSTQFPSPKLVISARKARTKGLVEDLKSLFPDLIH